MFLEIKENMVKEKKQKEIKFIQKCENEYRTPRKFNRFLRVIKYEDGTFGFMLTENTFGYFALKKSQLNKLRKFLK